MIIRKTMNKVVMEMIVDMEDPRGGDVGTNEWRGGGSEDRSG